MAWWKQLLQTTNPGRTRFLLYIIAFPAAVALDFVTPLGVADWLLEVILVWVACVWGSTREIKFVAGIGSATMIAGLFEAHVSAVAVWIGFLNRLVAILAIWTMVQVANRRRAADLDRQRLAAQVRVLQGLLPICASCKAIRTPSGEWQSLERYLSDHSEARLTHSLCPTCAERYMSELNSLNPKQ